MIPMTDTPFIQEAKRLNAWAMEDIPAEVLKQHGKGAFYLRHSNFYASLKGVTLVFFYEGYAKTLNNAFTTIRGEDEQWVSKIEKIAYVYDTSRRVYRSPYDVENDTNKKPTFRDIRELLTHLETELNITFKGLTFDKKGGITSIKEGDYVALKKLSTNQ